MELLENPVRPYAWGSRTVIAELRGEPTPSPHPEAEMWLGAHPGDPSHLVGRDGRRTSLLDAVRSDPEGLLGADRSAKWSGNLPYLLKVLAADEPLSLQAHPSAAQAAEGFARENAAGIPVDAPTRNYRDASHKPELICALTEFHALVGFREVAQTLALLRALDVAELAPHVALLAAQPDAAGLRALFTTWITLPQSVLDRAVPALQTACVRLAQQGREFAREARMALELSERYPGRRGRARRAAAQPGRAGAGRGAVPARRQPARLPVRRRRRADGELGQRAARRADLQARRRRRAAAGARLHPAHPAGAARHGRRRLGALRHGRRGVPAAAPRGRPGGEAGRRAHRWPADPAVHARLGAGARGGRDSLPPGGAERVLGRGQALWLPADDRDVTVAPQEAGTQLFLAGDGLDV